MEARARVPTHDYFRGIATPPLGLCPTAWRTFQMGKKEMAFLLGV